MVDFAREIDIKTRTHSREDCPSASLALSRLLSNPPLSQITEGEIRGGTDLRPWIHYGPDPITSLKCPVAWYVAVSLQK